MRPSLVLVASSVLLAFAPDAFAQPLEHIHVEPAVLRERPRGPELLLSGSFGALHHATTGTIAAYGYDTATAPSLGVNARLLFPIPMCRCLSHGVDLNYAYAAGPDLRVGREAAYVQHTIDASYAARTELPCMRRGDRRWWVTGTLGVSVRVADAGLGDVSRDDVSRLNERTSLSSRYDHVAVGWRLGGAMEVTFSRFLIGVALDLRDLYGVDTEQRRTMLFGAAIRVGGDFLL